MEFYPVWGLLGTLAIRLCPVPADHVEKIIGKSRLDFGQMVPKSASHGQRGQGYRCISWGSGILCFLPKSRFGDSHQGFPGHLIRLATRSKFRDVFTDRYPAIWPDLGVWVAAASLQEPGFPARVTGLDSLDRSLFRRPLPFEHRLQASSLRLFPVLAE